jgi:hypothetical protein
MPPNERVTKKPVTRDLLISIGLGFLTVLAIHGLGIALVLPESPFVVLIWPGMKIGEMPYGGIHSFEALMLEFWTNTLVYGVVFFLLWRLRNLLRH